MSAGFAASFIIAFAPQPRQRDDASIVPYKSFAAFITIGKVSARRDEGIPLYRYFLMFRHQPYPISYSSFLVPN